MIKYNKDLEEAYLHILEVGTRAEIQLFFLSDLDSEGNVVRLPTLEEASRFLSRTCYYRTRKSLSEKIVVKGVTKVSKEKTKVLQLSTLEEDKENKEVFKVNTKVQEMNTKVQEMNTQMEAVEEPLQQSPVIKVNTKVIEEETKVQQMNTKVIKKETPPEIDMLNKEEVIDWSEYF